MRDEPRPEESLLVRRAAGGDRGAFSALVEERWQPLVRLARSVVGDADAEDAVQDALVTAWHRLGSLRDPAAFPAWIGQVVLRGCLRHLRRRRSWLPLALVPEPHGEGDLTAPSTSSAASPSWRRASARSCT